MNKVTHDPYEIVAIVDEKDNCIGQTTREEIHNKGLLHREVCVYFINSKKQVLLQKRKDNHLWDHSSSGHFQKDAEYIEGAIKECKEELGIKLSSKDLKELTKERITITSHKGKNDRFVKLFLTRQEIPINMFKIDKEEVEEIQYFNKKEIEGLISSPNTTTASAKYFIEKYIIKEL